METLPIRLTPGQDLRHALEAAVAGRACTAAFVLSGIGGLTIGRVLFAGARHTRTVSEDLEILTFGGSIGAGRARPRRPQLRRTLTE